MGEENCRSVYVNAAGCNDDTLESKVLMPLKSSIQNDKNKIRHGMTFFMLFNPSPDSYSENWTKDN
jgi:hypothetical protein